MQIDIYTNPSVTPEPFVRKERAVLPTGFPLLDTSIAAGGWPAAGVMEVVTRRNLALGLQLMLPALAKLTHDDNQRWVALIAPPFIPSLPGLLAAGVDLSRILIVQPGNRNGIDVIERALASGNCSAVLAWPVVEDVQLSERLLNAAELGNSLALMFRESAERKRTVQATMRIELQPEDDALAVSFNRSVATTCQCDARIPYTQLYQLSPLKPENNRH